jgi:hypothetical protein
MTQPVTLYSSFGFIEITVQETVATGFLNRPDKHNAADNECDADLARWLRTFAADNSAMLADRGRSWN